MKLIDRILYKELKPYFRHFIFVLFLILLGVGFEAMSPLPLKILIDNVLGSEPFDSNGFLKMLLGFFSSREAVGFFVVLIYCVSTMMGNVTEYFVNISIKKLGNNIINNFSKKAFDNLEQLAIGYYQKQKVGDYIYRLSYDVSALGYMLEFGFVPLITNTLYVLSTLVIMLLIDVKLALLALAMLPVMSFGLWIFNEKIASATKKSETSNSALFALIQEVLSQLKIIQAFNQEKRESQSFRTREGASLWDELNMFGLGYMLDFLIGILIAVGYSVVILFGIKAVYSGEISTGMLIIFIFYLDNLTYPLISIMNATASIQEDTIKVRRMTDFFSRKFHIHDRGKLKTFDDTAIVFDNVSVYGEEQEPILEKASFQIPANKKTVIVGVSGSGKTTIISLILRFIEPRHGKIFIGGKDIRKYSIKALRDAVAYVPQEIVLFNESIERNIGFGSPAGSFHDIKKAAKLAVADHFIHRFPSGYNFKVGEEGMNLSGGQRQRLMLARALMKNKAKIAIFDEPLSSLDVKTRSTLMDNLESFAKGKTMVIVSNVLDMMKHADYVILVNQGRVIHAGDKKRLLSGSKLADLILHSF